MLPRRIRSFTEKENYIGPADSEIIYYRHTDKQIDRGLADKQTNKLIDKQTNKIVFY